MDTLLVGDIGGTNARFAIAETTNSTGQINLHHIQHLHCADYPSPLEALQAYLHNTQSGRPYHAVIGIATPITGDSLSMTNNGWHFSIRALQSALGLRSLQFINDFTALALALPALGEADRQAIGAGQAVANCAIALIGPGTGLGVSGLLPSPHGWIPIQGEGGHITQAAQTDEEHALLQRIQQQHPHVSAERLLSGSGLITLYQQLAQLRGINPPAIHSAAEITATLNHNPHSRATLDCFCALLGTTAANLALTLGARGGLWLGGGILPRLSDYLPDSPFRQRFEDKGRFSDYLRNIPTWLLTNPHAALIGAASQRLAAQQ